MSVSLTRGYRSLPHNIVRPSRVRYERVPGVASSPELHLKAFVNGFLAFDVTVPSADPLFLAPGLAGMLNILAATGTQAQRITNSPRVEDLSITGTGGYSFSDNFNRADAPDWGASWNQQNIGGDPLRYAIRSNQGVPVASAVPIVGLVSLNTPVGQAALTDAVMQYTLGTIALFPFSTMRLRGTSAVPVIGGKMYQLEIDGTTVGSPRSGQFVLWHTTIASLTGVTSVEMARIPPLDPLWTTAGGLIPGAVVNFSATVE